MRHVISGRTRKLLLSEPEFRVLRNLALDTVPGLEDRDAVTLSALVSARAQYRQDNPFVYQLDTGQPEDEPVSRDEQVLILENALRAASALLPVCEEQGRRDIEETLGISEVVSAGYAEATYLAFGEGEEKVLPYRAGYVAGLRRRIASLTGESKEEE